MKLKKLLILLPLLLIGCGTNSNDNDGVDVIPPPGDEVPLDPPPVDEEPPPVDEEPEVSDMHFVYYDSLGCPKATWEKFASAPKSVYVNWCQLLKLNNNDYEKTVASVAALTPKDVPVTIVANGFGGQLAVAVAARDDVKIDRIVGVASFYNPDYIYTQWLKDATLKAVSEQPKFFVESSNVIIADKATDDLVAKQILDENTTEDLVEIVKFYMWLQDNTAINLELAEAKIEAHNDANGKTDEKALAAHGITLTLHNGGRFLMLEQPQVMQAIIDAE